MKNHRSDSKRYIRGALTSGYEWLFLVLAVDPDGRRGSYRISPRPHSVAPQDTGGDLIISDQMPDMIAGILATWVCRLFYLEDFIVHSFY